VMHGLAFIGGRWRDGVLYARLRSDMTEPGRLTPQYRGPDARPRPARDLRLAQRSCAYSPRQPGV